MADDGVFVLAGGKAQSVWMDKQNKGVQWNILIIIMIIIITIPCVNSVCLLTLTHFCLFIFPHKYHYFAFNAMRAMIFNGGKEPLGNAKERRKVGNIPRNSLSSEFFTSVAR